jgi:hypothetical protein
LRDTHRQSDACSSVLLSGGLSHSVGMRSMFCLSESKSVGRDLGLPDVGEGSETAWVAAANYASFPCSRVLKQAVVGTRVKITCWKSCIDVCLEMGGVSERGGRM